LTSVIFLFWSSAARKSKWVKRELEYALARKEGNDTAPPEIIPIIIEGPPPPKPPEILSHLHFSEKVEEKDIEVRMKD